MSMRFPICLFVFLFYLALHGCGQGKEDPPDGKNPPPKQTFQLRVQVERVKLVQGGKAQVRVTAVRLGYDGPITLDLINLPGKISATKAIIPAGLMEVDIDMTAAVDADVGVKKKIIVRGRSVSDQVVDSLPLTIQVQSTVSAVQPRVASGPIIDKFPSMGKFITVRRYEPKGNGKFPAIILVHDSDGLEQGPAKDFLPQCCQLLAEKGYLAVLVHYFDRTGHKIVDPRNLPQEHLMEWRDTIADTVRYTAKLEKADPDRIGLLGFSLGAGLSLAVGAKKELKVAAIAEFFGFLHEKVQVTTMPPTLIIHGGKDTIVKVEKALELEKLLQTLGTKYEMKIYPDADHLFKANLLDPSIGDAAERTLAFFEKYQKNRAEAEPENKGQPKKLPVFRGRFSSRSSSNSGAQWPISLLPTEEMRICVAN